jgi:hypothetical protein
MKVYPDISEILARKAAGRRRRSALSFADKLAALDELRDRLRPMVQARKNRKAHARQAVSPQV